MIGVFLLLVICVWLFSGPSSYERGWDDGYAAGIEDLGDPGQDDVL